MSGFYGWTYANQINPKVKRKGRNTRNRYRAPRSDQGIKLDMNRKQRPAAHEPFGLGKTGRIIIVLLLIVISLSVLGKEPVLRAEVLGHVTGLFKHFGTAKQDALTTSSMNKIQAASPKDQDGTVAEEVEMQPRLQAEPIAMLSDHGLFILDKNGAVWPMSPACSAESFPLITGISVKEVPGKVGIVLQSNVDRELVEEIFKQPFVDQLSEIHFDKKELILYTRDGIKMKMENTRRLQKDLCRLNAVLEDIRVKNKEIAMVDLRYDQHIVVRPKRRR